MRSELRATGPAFARPRRNERHAEHPFGAAHITPRVTVRPSVQARGFGQRADAADVAQQGRSAFTDGELVIKLEPALLSERQAVYARRNRLTPSGRSRRIASGHAMSVNRADEALPGFPWRALVRAAGLHVGAAASAAALRRDLVETGQLQPEHFDEAYAVARLTPGTNLLAMYVLLGERFRGWSGALSALLIGVFVPSLIAVTLGVAFVRLADRPLTQLVMQGARAGALAVFAWAIVRLARPQVRALRWRGLAVAATTAALLWVGAPTFVALLVAGAAGSVVLREAA